MIAPLVGASYTKMHFRDRVTGGTVVQSLFIPPATRALFISDITGGGNNSEYRWYGPWVGADFEVNVTPAWSVLAGYDYHWGRAKGKDSGNISIHQVNAVAPRPAVNNTISQTTNFLLTNVRGHNANLSAMYKFMDGRFTNWSLGVSGNYSQIKATRGTISESAVRIQTAGPTPTPSPQVVNETEIPSLLKVNTYGASFIIGYQFG